MTPTTFAGIKRLGVLSGVGVVSIINLIGIIVLDGSTGRGPTWWRPRPTNVFPQHVVDVGVSIGLLFVGLDVHSLVHSLQKTMARPAEFKRISGIAYASAMCLYLLTGAVGYLMFGDTVLSEVIV